MASVVDAAANALTCEQIIFIGRMVRVNAGPMQMSIPPRRHYTMNFSDIKIFRGENVTSASDLEKDEFRYIDASQAGKKLEEDKTYAVGAHLTDGNGPDLLVVEVMEPANSEITQLCMEMASVPAGWKRKTGGGWIYPMGRKVTDQISWWSKMDIKPGCLRCVDSGRPALLSNNKDIKLSVEQIIPDDAEERMAPYGDGKFKVTVSNNGNTDTVVPCLLVDSETKRVSWEDSLLIIDEETKHVFCPVGAGRKDKLEELKLKANKSVSAIIDCLTLEGKEHWTAGGIRVYLAFCVGEMCCYNFFYYYCAAHERMHSEKKGKPTITHN